MGADEERIKAMETQAYRKEFSGIGLRLLLSAVIIYGLQVFCQLLLLGVRPDLAENMDVLLAVNMIPMYAVSYPLAFLIMRKGGDRRTIPARKMKPQHFLVAFLIAYMLLLAGNIVGTIVTTIIGLLKGEPVVNDLELIVGNGNIWITAIYTVLLAPIFEELLFRKILCDRVVKYGEGAAVLFSGLLFGLFHGNFNQFFYAFALGCFLAFLYVKTGNIKYTIGIHMMVNFLGSVVGGLLLQNLDLEQLDAAALMSHPAALLVLLLYTVCIYSIAIAGFVLFLINFRKFRLYDGEVVMPRRVRNRVMFVNAGMILCMLLFVILMIVQTLE